MLNRTNKRAGSDLSVEERYSQTIIIRKIVNERRNITVNKILLRLIVARMFAIQSYRSVETLDKFAKTYYARVSKASF